MLCCTVRVSLFVHNSNKCVRDTYISIYKPGIVWALNAMPLIIKSLFLAGGLCTGTVTSDANAAHRCSLAAVV